MPAPVIIASRISSEFLPDSSEITEFLASLGALCRAAWAQSVDSVLEEFFGFPVPAGAFHIASLHHIAFYAGDYREQGDLDKWLRTVQADAGVTELDCGPSYIAPREFGTPGWWVNLLLFGIPVELFSNFHWGAWMNASSQYKHSRMSHIALSVTDTHHVLPVLRYFSHYENISVLSYREMDQIGHTYGHLLNSATNRVLELTCSDRRAQ